MDCFDENGQETFGSLLHMQYVTIGAPSATLSSHQMWGSGLQIRTSNVGSLGDSSQVAIKKPKLSPAVVGQFETAT
jgi:hypothetical protein